MAPPPDTSDLRALARVILDQEDLEQSAMRVAGPAYDVEPVRRRFVRGGRVGFVLGVALGIASTGAGTPATPRQPAWLASFVAFTAAGTAVGAITGSIGGLVVSARQRRRLDGELADLVESSDR